MQSLLLCLGKLGAQIRNHHVPACQHAPLGPHLTQLLASRIENLDLLGRGRRSDVACADYRAVQTKSQRSIFSIQAAVVDLRGDHIFRRVARHSLWNERPYKQASNRSVPVRKVKTIRTAGGVTSRRITHVRCRTRLETHPLKSREAESPAVQCRLGVNADSPFSLCPPLIKRNHSGVRLHHFEQEVPIADLRKSCLLFCRTQTRHVVHFSLLYAHDVAPDLGGERRLVHEVRPGERSPHLAFRPFFVPATSRCAHHQPILPECLFIKEDSRIETQRSVELVVCISRLELWRINAELLQQTIGDRTVGRGAVDEESSTVQELPPAAQVKLVSLSMTSEVVVVLKNENASCLSGFLTKEISRGQPANSSPDNHQIVGFAALDGLACALPKGAVAQAVSNLER